MAITVRADRRYIRTHAHSERFLLVEVEAPAVEPDPARHRPAVNLAFVLDHSGSMSGGKLELARRAVEEALERLEPTDRFSVVVYDDRVDTVVESTPAGREAKRNAIDGLREIGARGSTNLGDGWLRGAEQVALHQATDAISRVLLLTDGLANVGRTSPDELAHHAAELRARGVSTSTFGVGADFDEALLQAMSSAGGGNFYYIERPEQIPDHITSEVGETLEVVARDAALEITAPEGIRVEPISAHAAASRGHRTTVGLGDLVSGQLVEVVLRLTFPLGEVGRETGAIVGLRDGSGVFSAAGMAPVDPERVVWTYADDFTNDTQARDRVVDLAVARQFAARARKEALAFNRAGDFDAARRALRGTRKRIESYAGSDAELGKIVATLAAEQDRFAAPMTAKLRKVAFFEASSVMASRSALGKAIRRP